MEVWRLILVPHLIAYGSYPFPHIQGKNSIKSRRLLTAICFASPMAKRWDLWGLIYQKSMNPKNCIKMSKEGGRISSLAGLEGRRHGRSWRAKWIKKEGLIYSCCSDGTRPVFFKIERL
jgi:hypothetical protein